MGQRATADLYGIFDGDTGQLLGLRTASEKEPELPLMSAAQFASTVPVYIGPWAGRPAPAAASGGAMIVTDYPAGGRSWWASDGTYWRPQNGRVSIGAAAGSAAAPVATVTAVGTSTFTLPAGFAIPAGMAAVPGARVCASALMMRTAAGAGAVASTFSCLRLGATAVDVTGAAIFNASLTASVGSAALMSGAVFVVGPNTQVFLTYVSGKGVPTVVAGAMDLS